MDQNFVIPIILSGGVGSRLWPLSREQHPKPFIKLADGQSLLQKTYIRATQVVDTPEIVTITNRELFFYTKDEYEETEVDAKKTYILEPFGKNTAAAIALAGHYILSKYGDKAKILILSADHLIKETKIFAEAIHKANELIEKDKIVTFGIKPTFPHIGYGYIESKGECVSKFIEKPNIEKATEYFKSGNYFWNAGIFCMNAQKYLYELKKYSPDIFSQTKLAFKNSKKVEEKSWQSFEISKSSYKDIRDISIDYAVLEKSDDIGVIPCDMDWSDIGSWNELGKLSPEDNYGNNVTGEVILKNTKNCVVHGFDKLIATIGLEDLVIVDTSDALLIVNKDSTQKVKEIVTELKTLKSPLYKIFQTVHRPWGTYTVLQEYDSFKIKRIEVKPNSKLSLQSHKFRSEHWIVVSGVAHITLGENVSRLETNQSIYIPVEEKHCIENKGDEILIIVEVQCGKYLGEDDIIRYHDIYGRDTK